MSYPPVPEIQYVFKARVIRWVDGDTVDLVVSLPFHLSLGNPDKAARFRLLDVNAYELHKPGGKEALEYVRQVCPEGCTVVIRSHLPDVPDNFGRWLCEVWSPIGTYLGQSLIEEQHAVPYQK